MNPEPVTPRTYNVWGIFYNKKKLTRYNFSFLEGQKAFGWETPTRSSL
jgi:hypothetical protein